MVALSVGIIVVVDDGGILALAY